jgi:hypothetical protein
VPRYYFSIRNGFGNPFDEEGVDLPDVESAKNYARDLARELMFRNEARKRHWWVFAHDENRNELFGLPFVAIDETIRHLSPENRQLIYLISQKRLELAEAIFASQMNVLRAKATIARARSRPYLAAYNGHTLVGGGNETAFAI